MTKFLAIVAAMSLALAGPLGHAAEPEPFCTTGTLAYVDGEINNNAIAFPGPFPESLPITSGVAVLKIASRGKGRSHKLTCALSGIPNSNPDLEHHFDHRLVCDDFEQSEISLNSQLIGAAPLPRKLKRKLCRGTVQSSFQERVLPDTTEARKGVFRGVYEAELFVEGCINTGADEPPDIQINMALEGYVCLER